MNYSCEWLESHMYDMNPPDFPCEWAKQNWDKSIDEITSPPPCRSLQDKYEPKRTVLYHDGHFIINERESDRAKNEALHGIADYVYDPFDATHDYVFSAITDRPWNNERASILSVEIGSPVAPTSTAWWFTQFANCTSIDLSNLDTSNTIYMNNMFANCRALQSLDVSGFDTSNVTTMKAMFFLCELLTSLDVSNFNTSNVTDMMNMFCGCRNVAALDVTNFDTSNVTTMNLMFEECNLLTILDLSNFDTSNVQSTQEMFTSCDNLQTIYASNQFIVEQVTNSTSMFGQCLALVGGAGTTYNSFYTDKSHARIDNPPDEPGYFTAK